MSKYFIANCLSKRRKQSMYSEILVLNFNNGLGAGNQAQEKAQWASTVQAQLFYHG